MFPNTLTILADQQMNTKFVTTVVITGLVVVFIALILLVVFIAVFGKAFIAASKGEKAKSNTSQASIQVKEIPTITEPGIDDEIIAVIAAAISAISSETGKKLAIRSIKRADSSVNLWARAGVLENTRPF